MVSQMTRVMLDAAACDKLRQASGLVELCDQAGKTVGYFQVAPVGGLRSPFSDEEIQRRRQEPRTGRPLAEILRDLGAS
jgi:hypothetical protein